MISSKHEMWEHIKGKNKSTDAEYVRIPVYQLERLVHIVWETAIKSKKGEDMFNSLFGGMR